MSYSEYHKYFTEAEIKEIYEKHVKLPPSYFKKWEKFPVCPVKRWGNRWAHYDFPRCWCVLDFKEWITKHNIKANKLAFTSETDPELEFIEAKEKFFLSFPPYDLHNLSSTIEKLHQGQKFDFFLFNQTIEHLYDPYMAVCEIFKVMEEGGYVFTSVPNINIPHSTPIHYGGFNPMGLAMIFKASGFDIIEIGQWGNLKYIQDMFAKQAWPCFRELRDGDGRVINEEKNVCQCWILARKPLPKSD